MEEDGRGAGANEALGIKGVSVYNQNKYILGIIRRIKYYKLRVFLIYLINKLNLQNTKEILLELDNTLDVMSKSNYIQYKTVFFNLKLYYKNMEEHIKNII